MYRIDALMGDEIFIGQDILGQALPSIKGKQVCIVTQCSIPGSIVQSFKNLLKNKTVKIVFIPEGEVAKSWLTVEHISDELIAGQYNRECTVIALGGGVVGDVAGFVASIYLRGVNFIQIPTTLLAQVDASVGGKTAINHSQGKNLIGSFYPPKSVIVDINHLQTLPERHFIAGLAEVVKIACVRDALFFTWLEENTENILARESEALMEMIYRAVSLKAEVVQADEKEQGIRMLLNFGHTVAHAIETATDYYWLHGEAVAVGMVQAAIRSQKHGLTATCVERIIQLLRQFGLPTHLPETLENHWQNFTHFDKKQRDNGLHWVLLEKIGQGFIKSVKKQEVIDSRALSYEK